MIQKILTNDVMVCIFDSAWDDVSNTGSPLEDEK
jgi:hypothetical protein